MENVQMHIKGVTVGPAESKCYILWNDAGEAMVIDPGGNPDRILSVINEHALRVVAYPLTHGHVDHVSALAAVFERHPAPIGLHPADAAWAFGPKNQMPPWYGQPVLPEDISRAYDEGQTWTDAGLTYRVLCTPGHSPGGVCFHFPEQKVLFSGDCLFHQSIGRMDLPGGDPALLVASLRRIMELPDETRVCPGHGPETTIYAERRGNPFILRLDTLEKEV